MGIANRSNHRHPHQHRRIIHRIHSQRGCVAVHRQGVGPAGVAADAQIGARATAGLIPGVELQALVLRAVPIGIGHKAHTVGAGQQQSLAGIGSEVKGSPATCVQFVLPGAVAVGHGTDGDGLGGAGRVGVGNASAADQAGNGAAGIGDIGSVFIHRQADASAEHRRILHCRHVNFHGNGGDRHRPFGIPGNHGEGAQRLACVEGVIGVGRRCPVGVVGGIYQVIAVGRPGGGRT